MFFFLLWILTTDGEDTLSDSFSGDEGGPFASTGLNGGIVRTLLLFLCKICRIECQWPSHE